MSLSDTLKELRHRHRMTLDDVAAALGSSKQTIYKYENGIVTNIPLEKILMLSRLFEVSASFLVEQAEIDAGTKLRIRVKDNSMEGARILEGDIIFVRVQSDVKSGEIVAVQLGDEILVRRVFYGIEHPSITLYPENALYSPIRFENPRDVQIIGKVLCGQYDVK